MTDPPPLPELATLARRHDPDRFLCALFAPAERRETVFALIALNHELARAREAAREPMVALIRLQWWRDAVEEAARGDPPRRHEVAGPLHAAIRAGVLDAAALGAMVEARQAEAEAPPADRAAFFEVRRGTAGALAAETGRVLGASPALLPALEEVGIAYGTAGVLRSLGTLAGRGVSPFPTDEAEGLDDPRAAAVAASLASVAAARLESARVGLRGLPRAAVPAALPGVLARRDLARILRPGWRPGAPAEPRGIGDRLAVLRAGLLGRT